jgi:ATP-binding cassette subfamily B protein
MGRGGGPRLSSVIGQAGVTDDGTAPKLGRRELRVLWPYLRRRVRSFAAALLLLVVSQLSLLATPYLLRLAIDRGIVGRSVRVLDVAAGLVLSCAAINWWSLKRSTVAAGRAGEDVLRSLRVAVFEHLASLDMSFFEREKAGRLVARLTSDVETIEILVTESLIQMGASAIYLVGAIAILFTMDVKLAAASLSFILPLMVVATMLFRVRSERAYGRVRERIARVLSMMQETVRGVHVVQAFGRERLNAKTFREVNAEWREANAESFRLGSRFFPGVELIGVGGTVVVLGYGGWRFFDGTITIGVLAAFVLYLASTLEPIQTLSQLFDTFQSAMAGLARLAGLLDEQPTVTERPSPSHLRLVKGEERVEDVTFRYRAGLPPALKDVELNIGAGDVIALVGPTGAGKSSIAKLLLRFYDPSAGRVTLDGVDLRQLSFSSLRSSTAIVPQEGFLFGGSVRDNIRFGRPDATDDDVTSICELLGIDELIGRLPDGYDTQVRERGAALSGGERQLIALARALLADPRVLVLDEATSALDAATESRVEAALRSATSGRTTIVIAHRLSTAERANLIVVVDHGRIVESGTHAQLVAKTEGVYARLYKHWLATA